jgi:hypothetical protein
VADKSDYEELGIPSLGEISRAVCAGEPVPTRERIIMAIGSTYACHPIHLWPWRQGANNQSPVEAAGSSLGYEANRKSVRIVRADWRPVKTDAEQKTHDTNGCRNCVAEAGAKRSTVECPQPLTFGQVTLVEVKWKEVADFVRPALTVEVQQAMAEYGERRRAHTAEDDAQWRKMPSKSDVEAWAAWRAASDERAKAWNAIEREGRALAEDAWVRAWGRHMVKAMTASG